MCDPISITIAASAAVLSGGMAYAASKSAPKADVPAAPKLETAKTPANVVSADSATARKAAAANMLGGTVKTSPLGLVKNTSGGTSSSILGGE